MLPLLSVWFFLSHSGSFGQRTGCVLGREKVTAEGPAWVKRRAEGLRRLNERDCEPTKANPASLPLRDVVRALANRSIQGFDWVRRRERSREAIWQL